MSRLHLRATAALLLLAAPATGQPPDPEPGGTADVLPEAVAGGIPDALRGALDALGASTGVPDGVGLSWYPRTPVRGQPTGMELRNYQFGLTAPVYTTQSELVFADASVRALDIRSHAVLPIEPGYYPRSRGSPSPLLPLGYVPFPRSLWDVQAGGGYVRQFGDGWSWGATLNLGTASDKPFRTINEDTLSALAFLRKPAATEGDAWLFYVVSVTNGQLGRNIPVPGVAYEHHTDRLTAVLGFPFVNLDYRPVRQWQFEFNYAALTDILARANYHVTDHTRVFTAYEWTNQAWFRAGRRDPNAQLFLYQMQLEGGLGWQVEKRVDFRVLGGYAFDRFFVENRGLGFHGRSRVDLAPGPFIAAQFELKF